MRSPCLFTRQQPLKLGYFYWLRVKNSNPLLTELIISRCYLKHTKFYLEHKASSVVFTSKTGLPRVVLVLRWVLFVLKIFVSPLSEVVQHTYSSDPRGDTGALMQLESRRAVPQAVPQLSHSPHIPRPQPGHFNNSTTRRSRSEKPLQTSGSCTFLSFSCFSIANKEAFSRSAALLL